MLKKIFRTDSTKMITFFYFFLLIYTIAALVWWGILLYRQNNEIVKLKIEMLEMQQSGISHSVIYEQKLANIKRQNEVRNLQYLGEGGAFLLIILLSAAFVYGAMLRQIKFVRQQQNFTLAVTHELKSPIAVIRLNIETLLKRKLPEDKQKNLLEKSLAETNRLNHLSNNMLLASRFENRQYEIVKEPLNLSELILKFVTETKLRTKKHIIEWHIAPDIIVEGDALMLQIVCSNLLENAQKYAPAESNLYVSAEVKEHNAVLKFKDEGNGIPDTEKNKIFDRFYRIGSENTRSAKGTGLGLFLAQKIVMQHGGQIFVKDNNPKGSVFQIILPLAKQEI